jgi:alpha-N-arabinofuranosidase
VICVLNRNKDKSIATDLISEQGKFTGDFEVYEVNGPDVKSENDFGKTTVKTVLWPALKVKLSDRFTYSFPPHSFTMLKGKIQ